MPSGAPLLWFCSRMAVPGTASRNSGSRQVMKVKIRSSREMPVLDGLLRQRSFLLTALAGALLAASWMGTPATTDWSFFSWGSDTMFGSHRAFVRGAELIPSTGRGGLHLYADYPFLQIGPPALLLGHVLEIGPREGAFAAGAVIQLLGLLTVVVLDHVSRRERWARLASLTGGALLLAVWTSLAHARHLDDALALGSMTGAAVALTRGKPVVCGLLLGLAAASKPWAIAVLPMSLGLSDRRSRITAVLAAIGVILLFWGPFVLADLRTLRLGQVHVPFALDSAPAAVGARGISNSEHLRLLQFVGGLVLATLVAALGAWHLVPITAFSLRLLIEPFPYQYYMASLAAAALIADLTRHSRVPWLTAVVVASWASLAFASPKEGASLRAATFAGLLLFALLASPRLHLQHRTRAR